MDREPANDEPSERRRGIAFVTPRDDDGDQSADSTALAALAAPPSDHSLAAISSARRR